MKLNGNDSKDPAEAASRNLAAPVAVIGMGCMFPRAESLGAYWANIKGKVDAITDVPESHWRPDDYFDPDPKAPDRVYARRGGFLSPVEFNPLDFGISPHTLEATDSTQLLGLVVAREALRDAGYLSAKPFDRSRVSVILGVTGTLELVIPLGARLGHPIWRRALREAGVDSTTAEDVIERISGAYVPWQENSFPGLLGNVAAGRIASRLDLGGTNCVVDAACASSLGAIHLASLELASGRCDVAVSGGLDTFNDVFMYMCFSKTPALSPSGHARPFDASGDGTTLGEGLGVIVLKRLDDAQRDGDRIYAVIRGMGSSSDGKGSAIYAPSASGQAKALRAAYALSGVSPATVELVEAHGTGTKVGDATEATALNEVYRSVKPEGTWCALGSVKSQIGHTKAAAGVAGIIKAILALHAKVLPPTIKVERPVDPAAPGKGPFYVNTEKRPWLSRAGHPRRAAVSAFGFGGSNFHCVLEEAASAKTAPDWDGDVQLAAFAGDSSADLRGVLETWPAEDAARSWHSFRAAAAQSRASFDASRPFRLVLAAERGRTDLKKLVASAAALLRQGGARRSWKTPDGAFFGSSPVTTAEQGRGKLVLIFPGQGSQHTGMLRDVICQFPEALAVLEEADLAFGDGAELEHGQRLTDRIYPSACFGEEAHAAAEAALRDTAVAQPALGAVSIAALQVLARFGVEADLAAGHSFGEITALAAAGWIDAASLHRLARLRGRLMAAGDAPGSGRDRGAMAAVAAPLRDIERWVEEDGGASTEDRIVVANRNSPEQAVVSGPTARIDAFSHRLESRGVRVRRLPVSAAFHGPLVAAASRPLGEALRGVVFTPGRVPVYSNTTARPYPEDPEAARALLAGQLAKPVELAAELRELHAAGARTFLEVGPSNKLTGLVSATLAGLEHHAIALDSSSGKGSGILDLAKALAQLAALGHPVDLKRWDEGYDPASAPPAAKPGVTVALSGANYVKPRPPKPPVTRRAEPTTAAASRVETLMPARPEPRTENAPAVVSGEGLRGLDATLAALFRVQRETADLHRRFLEGQEAAQKSIQSIIDAEQRAIFPSAPASPDPRAARAPEPEDAPPPAATAPVATAPAAPDGAGVAHGSAPVRSPTANPVESVLLAVVAEKTGYPAEMLALEMSLDSDLGIDSIKRVEIFSALREKLPDAPEVTPADLPSLGTLRAIAEFLAPCAPARGAGGLPAPVPSNALAADAVESILLSVVAEKTGYPAEMLALEMSLDSDLGIDSIKRVEIFSALRERLPDAPEVTPADLPSLGTLRAIAEHLSRPAASAAPSPRELSSPEPEPDAPVFTAPDLERGVLRAVPLRGGARKRISLAAGSPVWVASGHDELGRHVVAALRGKGLHAALISLEMPRTSVVPETLSGLVIIPPARGAEPACAVLWRALELLQAAGPALRDAGRRAGSFLIGVTRIDGAFGLGDLSAGFDLALAGLAGIVKTAAREWPEVHAKAIDLSPELGDSVEAAEAIATEALLEGPVEVGVSAREALCLEIEGVALGDGSPTHPPVGSGETVVVTGGARGVTAEAAVALAEAWRVNLLLLGRSPRPDREPAWLSSLDDEAAIKKALLARSGGLATPREIGEEHRRILAAREIRRTLTRIEAAGCRVIYSVVDVRDAQKVRAAIDEARRILGPVRGVVHGAGVLADRRIEDKTRAQLDEVFSTKVDGLQALLDATAGDDLRILALFSSSTGRFGRIGQADYAAANEALNKLAQAEARRRPACRVVSFNWGPWEGGMVTPALRRVFEEEGVGLIPLREGARHLVRELCEPARGDVEVMVTGRISGRGAAFRHEEPARHSTDDARVELTTRKSRDERSHPCFTLDVSLERFPFLRSHVLNGKAVVPAALIIEWLAHGALHESPGLVFQGFDDFKIFKGVILGVDEAAALRVVAGDREVDGGAERVPVELWSGGPEKTRLHARATVLLGTERAPAPRPVPEPALVPYAEPGSVYDGQRLFHGPELQAIERVDGLSADGIAAFVRTSPPPATWIRQPLRGAWLADPLAIDAAFQLLILWSFANKSAGSLPSGIASFRQFQRAFPRDGVRIVVRIARASAQAAEASIDFVSRTGQPIARIEGCECVIDASLEASFARNRLEQAEIV